MWAKRAATALIASAFVAGSLSVAMAQAGDGTDPAGRQDIRKDQTGDKTTPRSTEPSQSPNQQPK
jgi:hypothetical protein